MNQHKALDLLLALARGPAKYIFLIVAVYAYAFHHFAPFSAEECDQYFHMAVARLSATQGVVRVLPALDLLGWDKSYPNGYFLFSYVMGLAYRLGGEPAAIHLAAVFGGAVLVLLFLICRRYVPSYAAFVLTLALVATPAFITRLCTFRPQGLAIFLCLTITLGVLSRRLWLVFLGALALALSYSVIFVPLFFLMVGAAADYRAPQKALALVGAGLGGFGLGALVNPYFPSNVSLWLLELRSATNAAAVPPRDLPMELFPLPLLSFEQIAGQNFFFYGCVVLASLVFALRAKALAPELRRQGLFLTIVSLALALLTLKVVRGFEYSAPMICILGAFLLGQLKRKRWMVVSAVALAALPGLAPYPHELTDTMLRARMTIRALKHLPASASGQRVYHDDWSLAPYILYRRPDVRIVDVGNPAWLQRLSPRLFSLRQQLSDGLNPYPFGVIRQVFGATYVLAKRTQTARMLESDPHFTRLFPVDYWEHEALPPGVSFLYSVRDEPIANQVFDFDFERNTLQSKAPAPEGPRSPYLDLDEQSGPAGGQCVYVRPSANEVTKHAGATVVGLGGGRTLKLWQHERSFATLSGGPEARLLTVFALLPTPLAAGDEFEVEVCSAMGDSHMGLAMSLWQKEELEGLCRDAGEGVGRGHQPPGWCQLYQQATR